MAVVRIGTRASTLALTQTGHVAQDLARLGGLEIETVHVRTEGDRLTGSLASLGGTGVFVTALRDALLDGRCDVAVHSLKDLPTAPAPGLTIAAVPVRQDPRDALCARDGLTLRTLPPGARVGTGSPRRAAQLLATRPDLEVVDIRGNVDTRLGRVAGAGHGPGDLDAVVLARAGLARLGRLDAVTEELDGDVMLPAPGQGALAVEVRTADLTGPATPLASALAALDDRPTRLAVAAERALLGRLEAGCAAPVGALASLASGGTGHAGESLRVQAVVARTDGTATLRRELTVAADEALRGSASPAASEARLDERGAAAAGTELADLLLAAGAAELAPVGPSA
ncbi:hydroxymethylbilane synthase [Cellulomonas sp. DKR-3]|uniref:Porphobilinogen deaminase n=1 Tax=Cellulomonas fulva TaxID=2835530 RepID=A0ABS5TWZ3_9CELL|nr:hydroxymethylbilane synthase [Cellulomonas fulva]MBT0993612.1 hydroxymethylbilane synthase [Cellulomonas fulva]